ncbi:FKBP-type peptidyl-prolyl cis-trans isomerase [Gammaproteobacteria bacterium]|jgi:FKBP-type peptidyl-prolyl cis-trans isomerase|nr:FKBP-type peptidyl-prolyl cis-trans isomerase [Gammaproteobacteria bacterium]MDA7830303.1 FKBP-type peptidyl-prolyl cis-trans isomerase [Gammaproteobacteria bacterium]MDA7844661.1 FKBP-type peptidyl-prolyl cis-trans isomerase [Gammaproteobacteria bacterium]MDB2582904.1 FKBP-type peptidyl-prolyl cis-trans isomerase [Gammaproteobacteria bacterium]MDB4135578.1 FKBP-type peptidyl-prolyl cis-trans isomerase [Gammaproteobacteria bacterium]
MNKVLQFSLLLILVGCNQDSPNVKQIGNMQYFIENAAQDGINQVESGLQYSIISSGDETSQSPDLNDVITAHFHGTLTDGTVFWSSVDMNEPLKVQLSGLIVGCQKIIGLMRVGDKWRVYIDPSMAYGDEGRPGIPSNSILIFDIELLDIE